MNDASNEQDTDGAPVDVFLSHNSKDKPEVRKLAALLESGSVSVWFDEQDLLVGVPWVPELDKVIENAAVVVVALGSSGIGPWQQPEIEATLLQAVDRKVPVVPVLLPNSPEQVEMPGLLRRFTWLDFRSGYDKEGLNRLAKTIDLGRSLLKRSSPPTNLAARNAPKSEKPSIKSTLSTGMRPGWWACLIGPALLGIIASPPIFSVRPVTNSIVCLFTTLLTTAFALAISTMAMEHAKAGWSRRIQILSLAMLFAVILFYATLFLGFTEVPPETNQRLVSGLYTEEFEKVLHANNMNHVQTKLDFEYDTERIYHPWSIELVQIALGLNWLLIPMLVAILVASNIKLRRNSDKLQSERFDALVVLELEPSLIRQLQDSGIETIGDLVAMSRRQLNRACKLDDKAIEAIDDALAFNGMTLRNEV